MNVQETDLKALEAFVVGNTDLERFEALLDQFNILEVVGMELQEIRHSYFLSYVLDPRRAHNLGEAFLKSLLQQVASDSDPPVITPLELNLCDFGSTTVFREWNSVDIFLLNAEHKLAVIIENKVGTREHSDQLERYYSLVRERYPQYRVLAIYLTPDGEEPSHPEYVPLSYGVVCDVLEEVERSRRVSVDPEIGVLVRHYIEAVRRHVVSDSEVARLAQRINERHARAIDLLIEHRRTSRDRTTELILSLIEETPTLMIDREAGEKIRFAVSDWDTDENLRGETNWSSEKRILLFEVFNKPPDLKLSLFIGPGEQSVRERLFDLTKSTGSPFVVRRKTLAKGHNRLYTRDLSQGVAPGEISEEDFEDEVRASWAEFVESDLPRMTAALNLEE